MEHLRTRIFVGTDAHDATAQLEAAIADGSFAVVKMPVAGFDMWITHRQVIPGAMQQSSYELHVTAWVESEAPAFENSDG